MCGDALGILCVNGYLRTPVLRIGGRKELPPLFRQSILRSLCQCLNMMKRFGNGNLVDEGQTRRCREGRRDGGRACLEPASRRIVVQYFRRKGERLLAAEPSGQYRIPRMLKAGPDP